jgi:membrane fusion protein (multidrug efflux system)
MSRSLLLFIALVLVASCKSSEEPSSGVAAGAAPKSAPEARATRVEVATVTSTRTTSEFVRPGEIDGAREASLASALGGFVERVSVETGQDVAKNAPIAHVDTRTHAAQVRLTKVELDEARRELTRLESLGKAVASARVDTARSRLARAEAQHGLSLTRQSRAVIRAPFAGAVVGLEVEKGEVVSPGAPVARLIQLDPIHVSVSVTDRDVAALRVGGEAEVTTSAVPAPMIGKIARIEPAADQETRTFLVEVEVANAERRLLPGMIARVAFASDRETEAIVVPQDFIVTRREGNGVFIADDNVARWRPVELGGIVGTDVEVTSGLKMGERVVIVGHRGLADGDRLLVSREGRCCSNGRVVFDEGPAKAPAASPGKEAAGAPGEKQAAKPGKGAVKEPGK